MRSKAKRPQPALRCAFTTDHGMIYTRLSNIHLAHCSTRRHTALSFCMAHLLCVHWYLAGWPYRTAWCNSVATVLHGGTHAMVELHRRDILEEVAPQRLQLEQPLGVGHERRTH
jgi:hypothetical protein